MPNQRGNAYALTTLCPLLERRSSGESPVGVLRARLDDLKTDHESPFAAVPETYFVRLFVLDSVGYQGVPTTLDVLRQRRLTIAAIVVSESERGTVELADTVDSIARFSDGVAVIGLPRLPGGLTEHPAFAQIAALL